MGSGHHKITKWNHGIRISQYYRLEPWDQDITKLQSGTMGSGYHKVTDWNHGIRDHEIKNWNHVISISQNYRLKPNDQNITKLQIETIERSQEENHSKACKGQVFTK